MKRESGLLPFWSCVFSASMRRSPSGPSPTGILGSRRNTLLDCLPNARLRFTGLASGSVRRCPFDRHSMMPPYRCHHTSRLCSPLDRPPDRIPADGHPCGNLDKLGRLGGRVTLFNPVNTFAGHHIFQNTAAQEGPPYHRPSRSKLWAERARGGCPHRAASQKQTSFNGFHGGHVITRRLALG